MTETEILNGNKLMAEFMGYKYHCKGHDDFSDIGGLYTDVEYYSKEPLQFEHYHSFGRKDKRGEGLKNSEVEYLIIQTGGYDSGHDTELKYHSSLDWLMPVLVKIGKDFPEQFDISINIEKGKFNCTIWNNKIPGDKNQIFYEGDLIESVFRAAIEFLHWYNTNKK